MSEILTTYEVPSGRLYPVYDDSPTSGWVVVYKAADADALLRQREEALAQYSQEAADLKAQLREESQGSIERQGIIDGLHSERSRYRETLEKLRAQLAAMTAERDRAYAASANHPLHGVYLFYGLKEKP